MEPNQDRSIVLRPSQEVALLRPTQNRIVADMIVGSLAAARAIIPAKVDLEALVREGKRIQRGEGMTPENIQAIELFLRAASGGHAEAHFLIFQCYYYGSGIEHDQTQAIKWLEKSADHGHAEGQGVLGECYEHGMGVDQDHAEAAKWYQRAAEQNNSIAQLNLGLAYLNGEGVPQNPVQAYKWLKLAEENDGCIKKGETSVFAAALMTPYEIEATEISIRQFKEQRSDGCEDSKP